MSDAEFLVWLRNSEHARGKVGDSAMDVPEEEKWLTAYFKRDGDYYFITETACGIPVGAFGIYDVTGTSAEIGRWIIRPGVPAGVPAIIPGVDIAFEQLGLSELRTKVVSTNRRVIRLDQQIGFRQTHVEPAAQIIGGKPVDLIHMTMTSEDWSVARKKLMPVALMTEVQIRAWEKNPPPLP